MGEMKCIGDGELGYRLSTHVDAHIICILHTPNHFFLWDTPNHFIPTLSPSLQMVHRASPFVSMHAYIPRIGFLLCSKAGHLPYATILCCLCPSRSLPNKQEWTICMGVVPIGLSGTSREGIRKQARADARRRSFQEKKNSSCTHVPHKRSCTI